MSATPVSPAKNRPKPWAACDITYVREHYANCSAKEIAHDLGESVERVENLVMRIGLRKKDAASEKAPAEHLKPKKQIVPLRATSADHAQVGITPYPVPSGRPSGPSSAPPDLLAFVRSQSVSGGTRTLRLSVGTIHRLRHGYWPSDSRKVIKAWEDYKARRAVVASAWFLRRVRPGGVVRHAGSDYTAHQLAARTGQLLAVARDAGGGLVAQTLELPAERLPLSRVQEGGQP